MKRFLLFLWVILSVSFADAAGYVINEQTIWDYIGQNKFSRDNFIGDGTVFSIENKNGTLEIVIIKSKWIGKESIETKKILVTAKESLFKDKKPEVGDKLIFIIKPSKGSNGDILVTGELVRLFNL